MPSLRLQDLAETEHVGIRPQLVHWPTKQLVMDFIVAQGADSLHVLNPISPAFTTSLAFARDTAAKLLG
jgi:hypothetical protein